MNLLNTKKCSCGKAHTFEAEVITGKGAIEKLPSALSKFSAKKAFILADGNTYRAAGERVTRALDDTGVKSVLYIFKEGLEPDEKNVGLAIMNFDPSCDVVIGVGSGVINDIGKIVAKASGKPYVIVATAPSMDGYASATSSMTMEGLKISLGSKCADIIVGDTDVLCEAPIKMMLSGLGDMIAKYVSITEWRIASLITGEYYCEEVASLVRHSLKKCMDNAEGLLERDEKAVEAVFEGLFTCGAAMKYAGVSRPASGIEHYFSHIWDMRGVEFGTPVELHGIQCAVGTLIAIRLYEKIKNILPDKEKAIAHAERFDYSEWKEELRAFLGKGAESMIALEEKEQKYSVKKHRERIEVILQSFEDIKKIIEEELPSYAYLEEVLGKLGIPTAMEEIGLDEKLFPMTFKATKDIRDKYVLSRLAFDLGIEDEIF